MYGGVATGHTYVTAPAIAGFCPSSHRSCVAPQTAEDLEDIARGYHEHSVPLDVLVSDMAWHYHGEAPVDWGATPGRLIISEPAAFLQSLSSWGLNLTLNLHLRPVDPTAEDPQHYVRVLVHTCFHRAVDLHALFLIKKDGWWYRGNS